ncbi:MAG: saccharopine dehydrogenase NADP-binding domain-containing protein [Candidatus Thermoplasmatota archaeon]|nr:saccharopine dehydrogenase NADP-binding domain-containing protein [Candidatus Thermoplasmatota archaeon]
MKILVLGSGKMGSAIVFDLMKSKVETGVADLNFESAKNVAKRYKATPIRMDVKNDEKLVKIMKKYDAVISAVPYFLNYRLAKSAVKAKTHFCDLGGNTEVVEKELKLHEKAKKAEITIVPDCGLSPGLTNILAGLGYRKIKNPMEIHSRVGGLPLKPELPLNYGLFFSAEGLINEYTGKCRIIKNGKTAEVDALTEIEEIYFPDFGKLECFHTSGSSSTLPKTFKNKVKELDDKTIRYPGHCEIIKGMINIGLASEKQILGKIKPRELFAYLLKKHLKPCKDVVLLRVSITGKKEKIEYELIDYYDEKNKMSAMMRTTGYPTSIIAQMMANNEIEKGAFPPELCTHGEKFLSELSKREIKIKTTFS